MARKNTVRPEEVAHALAVGERSSNLTGDEFDEIRRSVRLIRSAVRIEQGFDLVVENYFEFEQDILKASLTHMVFLDVSWRSMNNRALTLNRRIMNTFSAGGVYFDQLNLKDYPTLTAELDLIKQRIRDTSPSYQLGRSLRNYMIHRDFDAHQVGCTMRDESIDDVGRLAFSTSVSIGGERLKADRRHSNRSLEIEQDVDIIEATRRYVEVLGALNEEVGNLLKPDLDDAEQVFRRAKGESSGLEYDIVLKTKRPAGIRGS